MLDTHIPINSSLLLISYFSFIYFTYIPFENAWHFQFAVLVWCEFPCRCFMCFATFCTLQITNWRKTKKKLIHNLCQNSFTWKRFFPCCCCCSSTLVLLFRSHNQVIGSSVYIYLLLIESNSILTFEKRKNKLIDVGSRLHKNAFATCRFCCFTCTGALNESIT